MRSQENENLGKPTPSLTDIPFADIFPKSDHFFKAYGFVESHLIRAYGVHKPGEVQDHENVMRLAEETAGKM